MDDREHAPEGVTLRSLFAGRRGRLLAALLFAEFGAAVQSIAYSTVLPIAADELHGTALYGATLAAGTFASIAVLAVGPAALARLSPTALLGSATVLYVVGTGVSAAAPAMVVLLAGTLVRGVAAGMLAGFGLSALGGLFEGDARARAYGLFAVVWLLPSVVGPAVNAAVAVVVGWRAAVAWPAVLVVVSRVLISRDVDLVPWRRSASARTPTTWTLALLAGLLVAGLASRGGGGTGLVLLAAGFDLAVVATLRVLRVQLGDDRPRVGLAVALFLLCVTFFGGTGIASLAATSGLGYGVVAAAVAVGAGAVAWSLMGFVPQGVSRLLPAPELLGLVLVAGGLCAAFGTQLALTGAVALAVLVAGMFVAGVGMGIAYPRLSASAMDDLPSERLFPVATAVEFAELSGTAVGAFVGGGTYSLARSFSLPPPVALTWSFGLLSLLAILTVVAFRALGHRHAAGPVP